MWPFRSSSSSSTLAEPLLEEEANMPTMVTEDIRNSVDPAIAHVIRYSVEGRTSRRDSDNRMDGDSLKPYEKDVTGRLFASTAPRIILETITARTALLILICTYAVFIIGFTLDTVSTHRSFTSDTYDLDARSCDEYTPADLYQIPTWGCSPSETQWTGSVTSLSNIVSSKFTIHQSNLVTVFGDDPENFPSSSIIRVHYNLKLWGCMQKEGCRNSFADDTQYTPNRDEWQTVLFLSNEVIEVDASEYFSAASRGSSSANSQVLEFELMPNTLQNQESIPTNGMVQSYLITVDFLNSELVSDDHGELYPLFSPITESRDYLWMTLSVVTRPREVITDGLTVILLMLSIVVMSSYIRIVFRQKTLLTEQKWIIAYFVLVILFQNPIYCVIVWFHEPPAASAAFASYVVGYVAQTGLFVLWLFFSDAIHRQTRQRYQFYSPKFFMPACMFICMMCLLCFQFPTVVVSERYHSSVRAVRNWSATLKQKFIVFMILYLCFFLCWAIQWVVRLYVTGRKLNRLPYMSTRYLQLSYRFFSLQATLVTLYYVAQYFTSAYYLSLGADASLTLTTITDNVMTVFRQQTQLFGKTFFLTVYAFLLAFLFLPVDLFNSGEIPATLAAMYTITEAENRLIVRQRKARIQRLKKSVLHQMMKVDSLMNTKPYIFCVEIAISLRNLCFQSYYDVSKDVVTVSGYGDADLDSIGYELVDWIYESNYEVFCLIVREKTDKKRLAVVFRGTASKRQMETNFHYAKKAVNFEDASFLFGEYDVEGGLPTDNSASTDDQHSSSFYRKSSGGIYNDPLDDLPQLDNDQFELDSVSSAEGDDDILFDEDDDVLSVDHHHSETRIPRTVSFRPNSEVMPADAVGRESLVDRAGLALTHAVDVTNSGLNRVVDATTGMVVSAAAKTPGLFTMVQPMVHTGFWDAYASVRRWLHLALRRELLITPCAVFFTGHSLGGALATFAALDAQIHTVPKVNAYLKRQAEYKLQTAAKMAHPSHDGDVPESGSKLTPDKKKSSGGLGSATLSRSNSNSELSSYTYLRGRASHAPQTEYKAVFVRKCRTVMYNFGSPRIGNSVFASLYNRLVPNSFRVVVDGDIVSGLPPSGYTHVGTEVVLDTFGSGSVIIDPSFAERWLRTQVKTSMTSHSLLTYRRGLVGLRMSAEYLRQYAKEAHEEHADPLKMVLLLRQDVKIEEKVMENTDDMCVMERLQFESSPSAVSPSAAATEIASVDSIDQRYSVSGSEDEVLRSLAEEEKSVSGQNAILLTKKHSSRESINRTAIGSHYQKEAENMAELLQSVSQQEPVTLRGWLSTLLKVPQVVSTGIDEPNEESFSHVGSHKH